jgi:hypothetical protein
MEDPAVPSSLIGAVVFFLLLGIILYALIRETLKLILKPALVVIALLLVAVWAGILDGTAVGAWLGWIGEKLIAGLRGFSEWVAGAWQGGDAGG